MTVLIEEKLRFGKLKEPAHVFQLHVNKMGAHVLPSAKVCQLRGDSVKDYGPNRHAQYARPTDVNAFGLFVRAHHSVRAVFSIVIHDSAKTHRQRFGFL